ncbi:MAG: D-galactonate dehydratase, partial [Dehalococcoidia bacterium]|nr:D-galactonate dehydratase [Dehalococcoidia bacterium]
MKITNIKTFLYKPTWNWLLIKMETDEGIYGWGEATSGGLEKPVEACIHNLADYLIGKDPRDIELHWSTMFRN